MNQVKSHTVESIFACLEEDARVYKLLTDEERAEVDAFNARMRGKNIHEIIAMGKHPFVALRQKYGNAK
jgi:ribosomal protein L12E/L44/L45/RPP1/RPP2